jgi:hypothetical protein
VVVQSSPLDQFPETKGMLSGRPIYTVYISMGTAKDWAMYFCVPGERPSSDQNTRAVQLTPVTPIKPPYPYRMVRPEITVPSYQRYIFVHGFVGDNGEFRNLTVAQPIKAETGQALLSSLSGWTLRAATRDGVPVTVEFVLSIPAAGL